MFNGVSDRIFMSVSRKNGDQQPDNKYQQTHISNTIKQQRAYDTLELVRVIYDVFKNSTSNGRIQNENRKDRKDVQ